MTFDFLTRETVFLNIPKYNKSSYKLNQLKSLFVSENISMADDIDSWIDIAQQCKYLPENILKKLCDIVSEILLEESNVQPVSTPVTVCGDIHGQVFG